MCGVVECDPDKETGDRCRCGSSAAIAAAVVGGRREKGGQLRLTGGIVECGGKVECDGGGDVFFWGG